jgi:hypothetical protein
MSPLLLRGLLAGVAASAFAHISSVASAQETTSLPQIDVDGTGGNVTPTTAGPVEGIRALTSTGATRTATPIEQVPNSVQVITRQLIDQQGAISQAEVFSNFAGVQSLPVLNFGQLNHKVRGFPAERLTRRPAELLRCGSARPPGQCRAHRAHARPAGPALFRRRQRHRRCAQRRLQAADRPPLRRVRHHRRRTQLLDTLVRHQPAAQYGRHRALPHHRPDRGGPLQHRRDRSPQPVDQSDADLHQQCRDIADHPGQLFPPRTAGLFRPAGGGHARPVGDLHPRHAVPRQSGDPEGVVRPRVADAALRPRLQRDLVDLHHRADRDVGFQRALPGPYFQHAVGGGVHLRRLQLPDPRTPERDELQHQYRRPLPDRAGAASAPRRRRLQPGRRAWAACGAISSARRSTS